MGPAVSPPGTCQNEGCDRPIGKKWTLCRICALAHVRGRHPYIEPCPSYVREPVAHLIGFTCAECGFDSAEHPGGGRVALAPVRIAS